MGGKSEAESSSSSSSSSKVEGMTLVLIGRDVADSKRPERLVAVPRLSATARR